MNKTGKRLSVAVAALIVALIAAIGVFAAWTIGVSIGNTQDDSAASEFSIYDLNGTPVASDEAARIIAADAKYPLASKLETYDNTGARIALDEVDPTTYEGFMASVNTGDAAAQAKMRTALDSGAVGYVTDDIVSAATLDILAQFFTDDDLGSIGPDYYITPFVGEGETAAPTAGEGDTDAVAPAAGDADAAASGMAALAAAAGSGDDLSSAAAAYEQKDLALINAATAWQAGLTGEGVTVAVVDMGLMGTGGADDVRHEDINYANVLEGRNCTTTAAATADTATPDIAQQGHGTFVAGEIIAQHNSVGVDGIAPDAKVRPYKVFTLTEDGKITGKGSYVTKAVNQAIKDNVDVITMSLGDANASQFSEKAFADAVDAGIIVIAACGNDAVGDNRYPAAFGAVIGVSAVFGANGEFADYYFGTSGGSGSNYGNDNVYVSAPGSDARGTSGIWGLDAGTQASGYTRMAGTSMAAPQVAAFAALAVQKYASEGVDLDQAGFKQVVRETTQDKEGNRKTTYDDKYGWGIIDCGRLATYGSQPESLVASGTQGGVDWKITTTSPRELVLSPASGEVGTLGLTVGNQPSWSKHAGSIQAVTVSEGVDAGANLAQTFMGLTSCSTIDLTNMAAGDVVITRGMFDGCSSLTNVLLPAGGIGSTATPVTNVMEMFRGCTALRNLDLSRLHLASSSLNADEMFAGCALASITLPEVWRASIVIPAAATGTDPEGHAYNGTWLTSSGVEIDNPNGAGTFTAAVTHPGVTETTAPTCSAEGATTTTCTICDKVLETTPIPVDATAHQWGTPAWEWAADYASATATRTCAHNAAHTEAKTGTSSSEPVEGGTKYTVTVTLSDGAPISTNIVVTDGATHAHNWGAPVVTKEPTCTEPGERTIACTVADCESVRTEDIAALGHDMVEAAGSATEPTCTQAGATTSKHCARGCGATEPGTPIPALGHAMAEVPGSAKAPTCTEAGLTASKRCTRECGTTEAGTTIPATGHTWNEGAVTAAPTCTESGTKTVACTACGEKQAETLDALGHSFKVVVTKEPTCLDAGLQHEACEREGCDVVKEDSETEVAALGHDWNEPEWLWNDDQTEADAKFVCARDEEHTETVEAELASNWGEDNAIERTATVTHDDKEFTDTAIIKDASLKSVEVNSEAADAGFDASIAGIPVDSKVELNIDPVSEGEVHDAIVAKAAANQMTVLAGIYDINLRIDGEKKDSDFGKLTVVFPVSEQFNGKAVTIHHCHGNDPANIESTDGYTVEDGKVVVKDVTKLSTFAVEVNMAGASNDVATLTPAEPNPLVGGGLATTGDQMPLVIGVVVVVAVAAVATAAGIIVSMRRSKK